MAQAVTRSLKITYGSFVLDSTGDYFIDQRWIVRKDYEKAEVACTVVVQNETAATFIASCQAIEAAFRTPRGRLKVEVDSTTVFDLIPSSNTGFNAEPSIEKLDDEVATGRSRRYRVSVRCELPADLSGQGGRRLSSVTLDQDSSRRRRISVSGRYTVVPGGSTSALATYQGAVASYRAALISGVGGGGTYDLIEEAPTIDDADKNCDFAFVLQEILYPATAGATAHASIRGAAIRFSMNQPAPGDAPGPVRRLQRVVCTIECGVDKTVSTDLDAIWKSEVRPYLIAQAKTRFGASAAARVDESPTFDRTANRIEATVALDLIVGGVSLVMLSVSVEVWNRLGTLLVPAYAKDNLAKYEFQGIAQRVRTTTIVESRVGLWSVLADGSDFAQSGAAAGAGGPGGAVGPSVLGSGGGIAVGGIGAGFVGVGSGGSEVIVPGGGDIGLSGPSSAGGGFGAPGGAGPGAARGAGGGGAGGYRLMETRRSHAQRRLGLGETLDLTDCTTVLVEEWANPVPASGGNSGPVTTPGADAPPTNLGGGGVVATPG